MSTQKTASRFTVKTALLATVKGLERSIAFAPDVELVVTDDMRLIRRLSGERDDSLVGPLPETQPAMRLGWWEDGFVLRDGTVVQAHECWYRDLSG